MSQQRDIADMIAEQGPMGALTATIDASSPLGPASDWSPSLVSTVRLMLSSRAEIVLFWGPDYCALYNEAYAPTIGDKHPRVLGRPAREGWAELWDDLGPLLQSVRDTGETFHAKDRPFYIERDGGRGEEVFFDISYSPVFELDGSIGGVLCIVSETTVRVLAEREARADRNRLWALARDPFLIADSEGIWLSASPAWTDILGWSQEELIGRTSEWMEHPDDVKRTRGEVQDLADGHPTIRFENRFRTKRGDYRIFSWTAVPEGDLIYCVARDVTRHRADAQALAETEAALRQAQKMETLGQLTGGVAHDFNNLLQIVTGNLDLLQRALPDDQPRLRRAADNAMAGAERAAILTQRLLAFSRRQPLAPTALDANDMLSGMIELLVRTLGEGVVIETRLARTLAPVVADRNQLENVVLNLAVNGRDAMPEGGTLTIETAMVAIGADEAVQHEIDAGDYVEISIADTGVGMPPEVAARAFDPFFTTKGVGKGTGLGLSQVFGFARQSGGHVAIVSTPGAGTRVQVLLPARPEAVPSPVGTDTARDLPRGRAGEVILVVEDEDRVRTYSVEALRELGYGVVFARDGIEALRLLERGQKVSLLFSDVVMPEMSGRELAARVRDRMPELKVLLTSGYAPDAPPSAADEKLLSKPFDIAALAVAIRAALDG